MSPVGWALCVPVAFVLLYSNFVFVTRASGPRWMALCAVVSLWGPIGVIAGIVMWTFTLVWALCRP